MTVKTRITRLIAAATVLACVLAQAAVREEQFALPVKVTDGYGKNIEHSIKVPVFSDDTNPQPAPVLVLNHGRAADAEDRVKVGRVRLLDASLFFVQRGFIVAVPTRVGYGVTGGEDGENSGSCSRKDYPPGYAAAAAQTLAVLEAVRRRSDAAKDRAIVAGQSYGGTTAVTVAALGPAGVQASINFAGGGGGNPRTQPQRPCGPHLLERLFRSYGETARIPMLWIYTENDQYFGPTLPKQWFDAFVTAGGKAEFTQFPPQAEDGHLLFSRHPELWQPRVAAFLDRVGFQVSPNKGSK
ncbi:MAG: dienelactone hydrolase [Polaromonas sp.]|nr:dienelactone hydrolase [Polaromonas sp.]